MYLQLTHNPQCQTFVHFRFLMPSMLFLHAYCGRQNVSILYKNAKFTLPYLLRFVEIILEITHGRMNYRYYQFIADHFPAIGAQC